MKNLEVTYLPLRSLKPANRNARTHSRKQIGQIADSLKAFGWTNPVLVSDEGQIVAGHGRVEAAKLLGMAEVPTIRLAQLSKEQCRIYALADNRLADLAGWDRSLLALELGELCEMELDIDVELTGFVMAEIDVLLGEGSEPDPSDDILQIDATKPPVTRRGDIWMLGEHRLICGDSLYDLTYPALMKGRLAELVFSDPPYNVPISGHVSGLGKVQHREFAMASGEMTEQEFIAFLTSVFRLLAKHSKDGSISFQCIDWRHLFEMLTAGREVYTELKNLCVWAKSNGGMGSLYRSRHELVCVFKNGTAPHVNNVELGRFGRYRTNVWEFDGMSSVGAERDKALALHPTVKPVALVAEAILDCSNRGGIVLDAFLGSGTTLLAAERTGRKCYGIEIDPLYVDVAVSRWQNVTKKTAVLESCGRTFLEMGAERRLPEATED
jgi:DNA modification methylase